MTLAEFRESLEIFAKYTSPDEHFFAAEHDTIYVYGTKQAVSQEDVAKLEKLGWFQERPGCVCWRPEHYNPEEGWMCYV